MKTACFLALCPLCKILMWILTQKNGIMLWDRCQTTVSQQVGTPGSDTCPKNKIRRGNIPWQIRF